MYLKQQELCVDTLRPMSVLALVMTMILMSKGFSTSHLRSLHLLFLLPGMLSTLITPPSDVSSLNVPAWCSQGSL